MRKKVIFIIVSFLILFSVGYVWSATQKPKELVKTDETVGSEEKIELTFWQNAGNPAFNQAYRELAAAFEAEHPNIKINIQSQHGGYEYELRLRTELAAGNHPDIMTIDSPNLALYASAGALLSLDDYMKVDGKIHDIIEPTLVGLTYEDKIYLAPIIESSIALYYNKHLFDEAGITYPSANPDNPLTWEEVLELALKISKPEQGIYGIDPGQGFPQGEAAAYFKMPLLWQFGAEVISPDGTTAEGFLNSEEAIEALQFYQDLYHTHKVSAIEYPPVAFETNKLGMTVLGSWHISELESYPDFKLGEDFGIAPLPRGKYQVAPNGGWALGISAKSAYPDEAWEFVKFVTSFDGSKRFVEITGEIPARYSVANEFPELNEYPKNIFVKQGHHHSKNRPVTPAYSVVSETIKILFEDVGIAGMDVREAADRAVERINSAISSK